MSLSGGMTARGKREAKLLDIIQREFPCARRPYAELARRLGARDGAAGKSTGETTGEAATTEDSVHATVQDMRRSGLIRRLGGVFDSRALGFHTTLVAAAVPTGRLEEVAGRVSAYPEVTHNYAREGEFNLWFTLVTPSRRRTTDVLAALERDTGVTFHDLPADGVFKREVVFRFSGPDEPREPDDSAVAAPADGTGPIPIPDTTDRRIITALAGDLPAGLEPFAEVAAALGLDHEALLARIDLFRRRGWLRRTAAIIAHRRAGVHGNAMVVWDVTPESLDTIGRAVAGFEAVTHCYARLPMPGWPYRLYAMVHAPTREEALRSVGRIASKVNAGSYQVLFSTREFKKTSPSYFRT